MKLIPIEQHGTLPPGLQLTDIAKNVIDATREHYERVGFRPPWTGYLAVEESQVVGTCGFKAAPVNERVEIAYFTFPEFEGRGTATAMTAALIRIARQEMPQGTVYAQTLPEENASGSVLRKSGFLMVGTVEHPEDGLVRQWERAPD